MRFARISLPLALILCACSTQALACKERDPWPLHILEGMDFRDARQYRVVRLIEVGKDRISGLVMESFGVNRFASGVADFYFIPNEEAHAVCRERFEPGKIYLLYSQFNGDRLEISRFNGTHLESNHKKYPVYLEDLRAARRRLQGEKK